MADQLTLEKLKIHERLASIETKMDGFMERIEYHDSIINGNGHEGVKVKIDRLEVESSNRKWHIRTLWVVVLGAVSTIMINLFHK